MSKLFKSIVRKADWPPRWKVARVTPLHKKGSVSDPAMYRPVSGLINLSLFFEGIVDDQFDEWTSHFVPDNQFGFVKKTGTADYGVTLAFAIIKHLNDRGDGKRGEGILISLDAAGTFDRI